jgi:hypothetical protein
MHAEPDGLAWAEKTVTGSESGEKVVAMTPHFRLALRLAEAKAARAMKGRYSGVGNRLLVALKRSVFEFPQRRLRV